MRSCYWVVARFSALSRDLLIMMHSTGRRADHIAPSGRRLSLFGNFSRDQNGHLIGIPVSIGESREIELLIFYTDEHVSEGFVWNIEDPRGSVLGTCEVVKQLGKWQNEVDRPQEARHPNRYFKGI